VLLLNIIVKLYEYVKKIHNSRQYQEIPKQTRYFAGQAFKKGKFGFHTIAKIEAGTTLNPTIETVKK